MSATLLLLIAGGGLALVMLVVGLVVSSRDEKALEERIGKYVEDDQYIAAAKSAPVADWLNTQAGRYTWGQRLTRDLARADIKLRAGEYVVVMLLSISGGALLGWWFTRGDTLLAALPGILLGAGVGYFIPGFYVRRQQGKRLIKFDSQLADMLSLMVNGLRAGYSTMQAMEAVSREMPPPISDEFRRVVQEMQLGVPMESALDNLTRRIPSKDLDLVITAINVQREVGGNLAEILDTISHTIRERVRVKGEIRVLTTQVMYSGKFLSILPIGVITLMYFLNRGYMMRFFNPATRMFGIPALIIGGIMIVVGYFVMTRIADIEV
jgi:tight adherence protein B